MKISKVDKILDNVNKYIKIKMKIAEIVRPKESERFITIMRILDETKLLQTDKFILNHDIDYNKRDIKIGSIYGIDIIFRYKLNKK